MNAEHADTDQPGGRGEDLPKAIDALVGQYQQARHHDACHQGVNEPRVLEPADQPRVDPAADERGNPQVPAVPQGDQTLRVVKPQVQRQRETAEQR
ncbi:MAG: hypothetical protein EA381_07620 [Planctomycetaceae bacterium]|nr:MAG: hypothetical protein EA381_07620 [Planctomycetaceae bacterium]